jgi:hypothetical protein
LNKTLDFKSSTSLAVNHTFETILKELSVLKNSHNDHDCPTTKLDACDQCKKKQILVTDYYCEGCMAKSKCGICESFLLLCSMMLKPKEEYDDPGLSTNSLYFILDNFDNLISEEKPDESREKIQMFYRQLTSFLRDSDFAFRFIFVTNKPIDLQMPKIQLIYPTVEYLFEYVNSIIHHEVNQPLVRGKLYKFFGINSYNEQTESGQEKKMMNMDKNLNNLIYYIVNSITCNARDFKVVNAVAKKFIEYALHWDVVETKSTATNQGCTLVNRCSNLSKLFGCNPKLAFRPLPNILELLETVLLHGENDVMAEVESFHKRVYKAELGNANKNNLESFNLPPIPGIILISCFIANVADDRKDAYLVNNASRFKSSRNSKKITLQDESGILKKKYASKERIEFIAQFLLDLVLRKKNYEDQFRELKLGHQSTQFIMSYQFLEDHKLIKRHSPAGNDEFSNIRFSCLCETWKVEKLAENLGLVLDEFVSTK